MSHVANAHQPGSQIWNTVSNFLISLGTAARDRADMERRMHQMRKLQALSDAELAKLGIARDRIAHHVFRDIYYV
ncbi:MAG: DUF1127 domain-containing protein [Paracoccaceae bacterium]